MPGPAGDRGPCARAIAYALLIGYALLMLVPFAWQIITSFKTEADASRLTFIPSPVTLAGWEHGFLSLHPAIPQLFFNSMLIAIAVTVTNLVLGSMAGYAFARLRFPRSGPPLPPRPRHADDPGSASAGTRLPDHSALGPDHSGATHYLGVVLILAIGAQTSSCFGNSS